MFEDVSLMPHAVCWAAAPRLIWTMVISNSITFLSYVTICITLLVLVRRTRTVIARDWAYFLIGFALFIVACGSTHLMDVVTTWVPMFWVDAATNVVTALLSAYVAMQLIRRAGAIGFGVNDYAARLAKTEEETRQMKQSLLAAQKLEDWSRLSAVLAHEISNPLETIQNVLYLIQTSEGASPEVLALSKTATDETTRVIDLARSTLSFFRQGGDAEAVNLAGVIGSVRYLLEPLIRRQSIVVDVTSSGDATIECLPGEVRQVLLNLVRNACEASAGTQGRVSIALTGQPMGVEVVIADRGPGIAPSIMPTLFQFGASTKGAQGNGMGLWTVKHIVNKHGGTIDVVSRPGEGARFTLWWPRRYAGTADVPELNVNAAAQLI